MGSKNFSDGLVVFQFCLKTETEYGLTKSYLYLSSFNGVLLFSREICWVG